MAEDRGRYAAGGAAIVAEGWSLERLTPPSRLFGANGLRTGPDGRIYVAQVSGSQISAIDVATGAIEAVSPLGGSIVAPDDIVFDDDGNLYATEITEGRVGMLTPGGGYRVICGDIPVANPITFHEGRLIAGECRAGGRIMELSRDGAAPRMILEDVPLPNAFAFGPDGKLYAPIMAANQIWRIDVETGAHDVVAGDLGVPDSVKFDAAGFIITTQVASGEVLRIDPRTGARERLAHLGPGLDNSTFVGDRLFVSNISGHVVEILKDGATRDLVPAGFNWPLGLAVGTDGELFVADGPFSYLLAPGGERRLAGMLFTPCYPGYARGAAPGRVAGEYVVTTANGDVARFRPGKPASEVVASGFDQLYGIAAAPGGALVFVERATGRVHSAGGSGVETLASGLDAPKSVAVADDGSCYVSETGAGRVVRIAGGRAETVLDGLGQPEGLLARGDRLFVLDALAKTLIEIDAAGGHRTVASGLPVGAPPGVVPKPLGAIGTMSGPMGPFAALAGGADGTIYISGDADGSVLALRTA